MKINNEIHLLLQICTLLCCELYSNGCSIVIAGFTCKVLTLDYMSSGISLCMKLSGQQEAEPHFRPRVFFCTTYKCRVGLLELDRNFGLGV